MELLFGTSFHFVIQQYLTALYGQRPAYANTLNLNEMLRNKMMSEYKKEQKRIEENGLDLNINSIFPKESMVEYYYDGEKILDWFTKNRTEFFNFTTEELVAIELPLEKPLNDNLQFIGLIDVLLRNKNTKRYRLIDLKTSLKGWNSTKKSDNKITDQLVIYKKFYCELFNVNEKDVDVEFMIFKRKLFEDIVYKQKRIIKFIPPSGKPTLNKTMLQFNYFIESCFDESGNMKKDGIFPKIPTESNCRYCYFAKRPELCNRKNGEK